MSESPRMGNVSGNEPGPRLALFLTPGSSLEAWHEIGMFDREMALYRALQERGTEVSIVSFGDASDLRHSARIPGINVLCNRWRLPSHWYARLLPVLHGWHLARADVFKTNQIKGGEIALRASRLWRKPLIARCGFLRSDFATREHGRQSRNAVEAAALEQKLFKAARRVVVTTEAMRDEVVERVPQAASLTVVIPNYVDTALFAPCRELDNERHVIFVGRVELQKNLEALLEAIEPLDIALTVIGSGSLMKTLQARFSSLGDRVHWRGNVPNRELPGYLNQATLFVLPSHYEGHPKALLEAMACGVPVMGAESPGIRELIHHGENGWLCGTDPASIRGGIVELLGRPGLRDALTRNARRFVESNFSLDQVVEMELAVLRGALGQ